MEKGKNTMQRLFYCTESETMYTLSDLENYRQMAIADGDTLFTDTLENFVKACSVDNNGTLLELRIVGKLFCAGKLVYVESNIKSDLF
jgi:hypothetical protein